MFETVLFTKARSSNKSLNIDNRNISKGRRLIPGFIIFLLGLVFFFPGTTGAWIRDSRHDFKDLSFAPQGGCSACHVPHDSPETLNLWSRDLSDEYSTFDQSSNPNYIPVSTIHCYDCHTDGSPDNDPSDWGTDPEPHDIAINGSDVGFYELEDGTMPGTAPTDGSPTGGHYWKSDPPSGTPAYSRGDKLACTICHDPHDEKSKDGLSKNQVMFLTETDNGEGTMIPLVSGETASGNTRYGTGNGRAMCIACHGLASGTGPSGTPVTMWGVLLPEPPPGPGHYTTNTQACTGCHDHNFVTADCDRCHGYPPLTGGHQRHMDALVDDFACDICHGPFDWEDNHNEGSGVVASANVDIIGHSDYWYSPKGVVSPGYTGVGSYTPVPTDYEFWAKGGDDQRCSGLACHGEPPDTAGALNWTDTMVDASGDPVEINICIWCHDETYATIDTGTTRSPNVMGNGSSFGANINGHGLSGSQYDLAAIGDASGLAGADQVCTVCHEARYSAGSPIKPHFDQTEGSANKRLRNSINSRAISDDPDETCLACHQNGSDADGQDIAHHGNDATAYTPTEPDFTRVCRQCHEVHGSDWNGTGRNLHMVGKWVDADRDRTPDAGEGAHVDSNNSGTVTGADNAVVFISRTGADSYDENDGPAPDDAADNQDDICGTCHSYTLPVDGPNYTGGGDHEGTGAFNSDERGNNCFGCHDHDYDDDYTTPDAFMPSGCAGCHGEDCYVHPGCNGTEGDEDDAPNVMTVEVGLSCYSVWNGEWWDSQMGVSGDSTYQQGGHGDPDGTGSVPECTDCHDIGDPPDTHFDCTHQDVINGTDTNSNTAHLDDGYIIDSSTTSYDVQVTFDNYCGGPSSACHDSEGVVDMRHERDTQPSDPNYHSVEFGTHLTVSDGESISYPVDSDISDKASTTGPDYAPCVSCHDPHGTTCTDTKGNPDRTSNFMLRDDWQNKNAFLCKECHL